MTVLLEHLQHVTELLRGSFVKYLLLFIFAIFSSVLEILGIGLIFPFFSFIMTAEGNYGSLPPFLTQMMETVVNKLNLEIVCLFLVIVFTGKNVVGFIVKFESAKVADEIRGKWMHDLFHKYVYSHYAFFVHTKHGVLTSNLFTLTQQSVKGLKEIVNIFMFTISFAIALTVLFLISWHITTIIIIVVGLGYIFLTQPLMSKAAELGARRVTVYQQVNAIPAESFKGIREIKSYSAEDKIIDYYENEKNQMVRLRIKLHFYNFIPSIFPEILFVTLLSVTLIILNRVYEASLNQLFPVIATYAYASLRILVNGSNLVKSCTSFSSEWPSIKRLYEEMRLRKHKDISQGDRAVKIAWGNLQLNNITFSYSEENRVLNGVNAELKMGEFTAIVGGSGAGKSTIADLIIRLYEPDSGTICHNGVNIKDYSLKAWRGQIGFVSQDAFLFHGTIRENISFGLKGKASENTIIEAAKKANAYDFIMNTEKGFDTIVGERGAKLSGGQRQRIAIARAFVRDPKILILDEATSALDTQSENLVIDSIEKIKGDVILIVIAHRLSTVIDADKILVMKDGRIVEKGTHQELLGRKGEYWRLYQSCS